MDKYSKTRFNFAPTIMKPRTRFDLSHKDLTTFNTGDFVPLMCEEVYPGETIQLDNASLLRLETSLHQTMDDAFLEFAFFFVPYKLIWVDFDKFMGANDSPWANLNSYEIPQLYLCKNDGGVATVAPGSLYNHLCLPAGNYGDSSKPGVTGMMSISALPLKAVFQIWNDWYRDENYDTIISFSKSSYPIYLNSSFTFNGKNLQPEINVDQSNYKTLKVNRFHDIFSSVLPAPQKGVEVSLPLAGDAPVVGTGMALGLTNGTDNFGITAATLNDTDTDHIGMVGAYYGEDVGETGSTTHAQTRGAIGVTSDKTKSGLKVLLDQATATTVNQFRLCIAAQSIKERDARAGTRMKEIIHSTWGIDTPSLELDRAEFLGGKRIPINMLEVLQTSETGTTVLGSDAGHSKTLSDFGGKDKFIRSFSEYGLVLGFCYVRTSRSYSQGIDRKFFKKTRYDLYDPMLDNIGEVDVKGFELKADYDSKAKVESKLLAPIGYQEPWYWLKEGKNRISGFFQSGITGTLDSWHYGDDYNDYPVINADWLKEGPENVDRTIAVQSNAAFQWRLFWAVDCYVSREMSKYNIPNTFGFGSK